MSNYLLLRDNKETGPFSLEELVKYGLKPYDLVWIPGKSAAWRYPSEISELMPYAPQVEEQPFDRFYKKPSADETQHSQVQVTQPIAEKLSDGYEAYQPKAGAEAKKPVARKAVFVTMPGQNNMQKSAAVKTTPPVPKPVPAPIPDYTMPDDEETISVTEKQAAKIKYSQPLDDIKEMYVKTLKDRKDRIARKSFMKVSVKRAAVVIGLIGIGVLAGFILKSRPAANAELAQQTPLTSNSLITNQESSEPANTSPQSPDDAPAETVPGQHLNENIQAPVEQTGKAPELLLNNETHSAKAVRDNYREELPAGTDERITPKERKKPLAVMSSSDNRKQDAPQYDYSPSETNPSTGERNRSARNTLAEMSDRSAVETRSPAGTSPVTATAPDKALGGLGSQVSVSSNDYKRVALGGIRNLELTVNNRSKYDLDEVAVELQYFKPNDQVLKTQVVHFKSIGANQVETLRIPDTNRGVRIEFKIVRIGSSQLADR